MVSWFSFIMDVPLAIWLLVTIEKSNHLLMSVDILYFEIVSPL